MQLKSYIDHVILPENKLSFNEGYKMYFQKLNITLEVTNIFLRTDLKSL
jgi:hypothetical protein